MTDSELLTHADIVLMQGLAQRVTAVRQDLLNADASYGELAWNWGRNHAALGAHWRRRLWFHEGELTAWAWAHLPRTYRLSDGTEKHLAGAYLAYQAHPAHAGLVDEVIEWFDDVAAGLERTVLPGAGDAFALERWAAHGYVTDPSALGDAGSWMQCNVRELTDLTDLGDPTLPAGFRFRTADEAGPEAAVRAHVDAWSPSPYTVEGYEGVRRTPGYRSDLHLLVESPDGTMACSTIMWLDEANKTAEFEPVGTHPAHRRRGLARTMLVHGMHLARAAGAVQMTVCCLGAPGHPAARGLYYGVGFRPISRDAPMIKYATTG
ncbi:GNAT family N-acetyltransferase [Streptomyces indicus]|uniref:Acetyltransferase (GNAT) family protein n=1 Tax=Streptomyces indicus TaxID=417292 RepID=A0A1G8TDK4_9ACTN|nr:GNAT family N-acetyltransferase [Streptomyces indicus]SDJ39669.1 Acetyltransferase (GNAT) family protein [Streptomyces indicus]